MKPIDWIAPKTIAQAANAASTTMADLMGSNATGGAVLKAGGIDVIDLMKEGLAAPSRIVNLREIPGLDFIEGDHRRGLKIGALTTLSVVGRHPGFRPQYAALADAVAGSGSVQLRNVSTLGGNLLQRPHCWYFRSNDFRCRRKGGTQCFALLGQNQYHAIFENENCAMVHPSTTATALVALKAEIVLADSQERTRQIALEDFFVGPGQDLTRENDLHVGEVLTAIVLPPQPHTTSSVHLKVSERASFDWPIADVAVALDLSTDGVCIEASIVLGAAAPVPYRAEEAEAALLGLAVDSDSAATAARAALGGANPLAHNRYKLPIFAALIRRAILQAVNRHNEVQKGQ